MSIVVYEGFHAFCPYHEGMWRLGKYVTEAEAWQVLIAHLRESHAARFAA